MKKLVAIALTLCMLFSVSVFTGCGDADKVEEVKIKIGISKSDDSDVPLWNALRDDFEAVHKGEKITIDLVLSSNLEVAVRPMLDNGIAPDIMFLPTGKPSGLTEELINSRALIDLSELLETKAFGEDVRLSEKFLPGFLDTMGTNPYQGTLNADNSTYALPMFYSPKGMVYNKDLFNASGVDGKFKLPTTFDNLLNIRAVLTAKNTGVADADKQYLFGYGDVVKTEGFISSVIGNYVGKDIFECLLNYDNVYKNEKLTQALTNMAKLSQLPNQVESGDYIYKPSMGSGTVVEKQTGLFNDKVLFMPTGIEFFDEMKNAAGIADKNLGFISAPAASTDSQSYTACEMQQIYILNHTEKLDASYKFMQYLFSDRGAKIVSEKSKKVIPTTSAVKIAKDNNHIDANKLMVYNIFNGTGNRPLFNQFMKYTGSEVNWSSAYVESINSIFKGEGSSAAWLSDMELAASRIRASMFI